jgi:hypothetical protein
MRTQAPSPTAAETQASDESPPTTPNAPTPEELASLIDITAVRGAVLPLELCGWEPNQRQANLELLLLLGELVGRLERSPGGFSERARRHAGRGLSVRGRVDIAAEDEQAGWLTLREVDEQALQKVLDRVERINGHWRFEQGRAETLHDRVACHFGTAQLRRKRGLA